MKSINPEEQVPVTYEDQVIGHIDRSMADKIKADIKRWEEEDAGKNEV